MIIIAGKVLARRGLERELPGTPITTEPLTLSAGLDVGEIGFTEDTGRLFIGYDPSSSDVNYKRGVFPYQNLEILTENSPRNRELFSDSVRAQDGTDFFVPFAVTSPGGSLSYTDTTLLNPAVITGTNISVVFEYHAFNSATNVPVQQGTLRYQSGGAVSDNEKVGTGVTFTMGFASGIYTLAAATTTNLNLYLRRVVIGGL
jgi:hypothetical protein